MVLKSQDINLFKALFLLAILSPLTFIGQGVRGDQIWHQGKIFLNNKDTLSGLIKYNFKKNQIEYKQVNEYRILLPNKFYKASFTSLTDSSYHEFEVFKVETSHNYYRPYFFEAEDTLGKIKVYKQYYWTQKTTQNSFGIVNYGYKVSFDLFQLTSKKRAIEIKQKKRAVLNLLKDKKHEIKKEARKNKWRYNETYDVLQIIKYYNSLFT